jgi:hypothetical protein
MIFKGSISELRAIDLASCLTLKIDELIALSYLGYLNAELKIEGVILAPTPP